MKACVPPQNRTGATNTSGSLFFMLHNIPWLANTTFIEVYFGVYCVKKIAGITSLFQLEPASISIFQLAALYFTFIISTIDIFDPYLIVLRAGRDGWISVLIALLFMLPVVANALVLTLRFPRRSLIEYSQMILGLWPGRLLGVLYLFFILVIGVTTIRELEEFMSIAFFPRTPGIVFGILTVILTTYIIWSGLEVISRVNSILLPLGFFFLTFVFFYVLPSADFSRYLPILENGLKPLLQGSFILVADMMEGFSILAILPFVKQPRKIVGAAAISVPLVAGALLTGTIAIPVLGLESSKKIIMPALELSRLIEIPGLPRLDVLIMVGWFAGIFIKLSLAHYLLVIHTAQWAGLGSYKPLIMPIGIIMIALSMLMFSNALELVQFVGSSFTYLLLTFEFPIPLMMLIIAWLRGVEEKEPAS